MNPRTNPYSPPGGGTIPWELAGRGDLLEKVDVEIDNGFFRVRFDRCTPLERNYLRSMAELGPGSHKSGDMACLMNKSSQQVAPIRAKLISKGMIYGPLHGDNNFTVPLFDEFMKRNLPNQEIL